MSELSYEEVILAITKAGMYAGRPGVECSRDLLAALSHPGRDIPFIHVAGTNGKGSVCAFLTRVLMEAGLLVGTYTSPHLIRFEERITVGGVPIEKEEVARLGSRILKEETAAACTMSDLTLAMALLYFKERACEIMILETGLGGRLDSTNALGVPMVSVITKIGFDHMAILGDSLAQIAAEKAGILKRGTFVVTEQQKPEAKMVLEETIQALALPAVCVSEADIAHMKQLPLLLRGVHQRENAAAAALAAKYILNERFPDWDKRGTMRVIDAGLMRAVWPGRMELLSEKPFLLVDGAHNEDGANALFLSLSELYPGERFCMFMGVMADKDYRRMAEALLPLAKSFGTFAPKNARALSAEDLLTVAEGHHIPVRKFDCIQDIVQDILHAPQHGDKFVAFGSLYFIGELKAAWESVHSGI